MHDFATKQNIRSEKNAKDNVDYAFVMRNGTHSRNVYKCIMDLRASKHMTLYRAAFDMYEVITPHNVRLGDNNIVQAIRIKYVVVKNNIKRSSQSNLY